ncbi:chaperonin 10-like protein [Mucor lusitanicus]
MSANNKETTHAWAGVAKGKPLVEMDLPLKKWSEDDVQIDVTHCGLCGSDDHMLNESWGPTHFPVCVGHEIVGVVSKVGSNVKHVKVGDRAGGNENICPKSVLTYGSQWYDNDAWATGGYGSVWRGDNAFVFKIPDDLSSEGAATLFCAGITTFAPLKRCAVGKDSVVGVMGIGGLGHFGILWAKAMGAKVVGMSHNDKKREVAKELGCDDYINTSNEEDMAKYNNTLTHILCTGTSPDFQWAPYFALLRVNGHFINVMAPNWQFPELSPLLLIMNQVFIHGSAIGSPAEIQEMLDFAAEHNVKPWIEVRPMKDINNILEDFRAGKPRFRYVMEH